MAVRNQLVNTGGAITNPDAQDLFDSTNALLRASPQATIGGFQPETLALLGQMPVQTANTISLIDAAIASLKASGVWAKLDCLWVPALLDRASAKLNWRQRRYPLVENGTLSWIAGRGFTGDGSTGWLGTGFTPSTANGQYQQNSASVGVFVLTPSQATTSYEIGTSGSTTGPRAKFAGQVSGVYQVSGFVNDATNTPGVSINSATGSGLIPGLLTVVQNNGTQSVCKNGAVNASASVASTGLPSQEIWFLRNGSNYSTSEISLGFFGAALTAADVANIWAAFNPLLTGLIRPIAIWGDSLIAGVTNNSTISATPWPSLLSADLGNRYVYNGGVPGQNSATVLLRMQADTFFNGPGTTVIIEGGVRNDVGTDGSSLATVSVPNIASMNSVANGANVLVMAVTNTLSEYAGSTAYAGASTAYANIVAFNATMASTYGNRFVNQRKALVAAYDPTQAQDVIDYGRDTPPTSLHAIANTGNGTVDQTHFSDAGYVYWKTSVEAGLVGNRYP